MKKKITFIVTTLNAGGINNFLLHLLAKIDTKKIEEIKFLYTLGPGDAIEKFKATGATVKPCLRTSSFDLSFSYRIGKLIRRSNKYLYPFRLFAELRKNRPDIVYSHDHHADILTPLIICYLLGIKFILQVHSIENKTLQKSWYVRLLKVFTKKNDVFLFGSYSLKSHYSTLSKLLPDNIRVIYYFVNDLGPVNKAVNTEIKKQLGIEQNAVVLGFIGRLITMKHVDTLVEAFYRMNRQNIKLVIIGDGSSKSELTALVERLGLTKDVHFIGKVTNPEYWLNIIDINVLPTEYEGQPIAVIECMNKGIVNVCSNVIGVKEIVEHKYNGLLFEFNNADDLKLKLEDLIDDTALKTKLINNGLDYYHEHFNPDVLKNKFEELLEI